jgi:hypothetical protein
VGSSLRLVLLATARALRAPPPLAQRT